MFEWPSAMRDRLPWVAFGVHCTPKARMLAPTVVVVRLLRLAIFPSRSELGRAISHELVEVFETFGARCHNSHREDRRAS